MGQLCCCFKRRVPEPDVEALLTIPHVSKFKPLKEYTNLYTQDDISLKTLTFVHLLTVGFYSPTKLGKLTTQDLKEDYHNFINGVFCLIFPTLEPKDGICDYDTFIMCLDYSEDPILMFKRNEEMSRKLSRLYERTAGNRNYRHLN